MTTKQQTDKVVRDITFKIDVYLTEEQVRTMWGLVFDALEKREKAGLDNLYKELKRREAEGQLEAV